MPKKFALPAFFALCFLWAWGVWVPAGLLAINNPLVILLGAWAPTVAALSLTWLTEGRAGLKALLGGLLKWRVAAGYYVAACLGIASLLMLAIGLHVLLGGQPPNLASIAAQFGIPPEQAAILFAIAPIIFITSIFAGGPIAEELGWRGFAQPRLQTQFSPEVAGLLIGLIWSAWHLPLFFFFPSAVGGLPLTHYIPIATSLGVIFAWLYNRTQGSVLLCVLLHAGTNFALGLIGGNTLATNPQLLTIFTILLGGLALLLALQLRAPLPQNVLSKG